MDKKNYITPAGLKRLLDEQDHLLKDERPKVTEVVSWAASLGDRSENADYIYGKKRLREIDRRLRFLAKRIESAEAIDPESINSTKVQFGATVEIEDEEGETKTLSIVGIDETNTPKGLLSWISPIAKAMLGKEEGDSFIVRAPKGDIEYEIISIEYKKINLE